jgi:hypothetical protein
MFKVNMNRNGSDEWAQGERGQMDVICNIQMINPNQIPNAYGIYSASQVCTFENIRSRYFCQTFRRYTAYIDCLTLRNIFVEWSRKNSDGSSDYQIDMGYIGDNLLIDNVSTTVEWNENSNEKLLHVKACGGGVIQRITNGTIYIEDSKALTISGVHQEFGNTIIQNSQVEINGMCHFKHPGIPAFSIKSRESSYEHRTVELKNIMILYNLTRYGDNQPYHLSPYSPNELDIELYWLSGALKIENVFRSLQRPWTEASSLYGIRVNNNAFMKNPAANSISSIVISSSDTSGATQNYDETIKGVLLNNHIAYQITQSGSYSSILDACFATGYDTGFGTDRYFPAGTYTYRAAVLLDRTRNIGYYIGDDWAKKEITVSANQTSCIYLSFYRHYYVGMYIRLFRKKSGTNTIDYIDLPVCTSHNIFFDLGDKTQFCELWTTVNDNQFSSLIPQTCYNYQFLGNNVYVKMPNMPNNTSDWEQGDMIYLTSNNSLNVI